VLGAVVGVPQLRLDEQFLPKNKVFFVGWIAFGMDAKWGIETWWMKNLTHSVNYFEI
jgi:hypothetical protein